jgi:hypothetical protein
MPGVPGGEARFFESLLAGGAGQSNETRVSIHAPCISANIGVDPGGGR